MIQMLRLPAVTGRTGRSRTGLYEDVKAGLFTKPVKLGARAIGWPDVEVSALVAARVAGKGEDEIRSLVARLETDRRAGA